ncbi:MAG: methylamine dehydrogenase accessory protein MauD [Myxococcales bacterium]|nr:MAG: methylamine dehydrogenase accessory protein MauD [Myxococcales bacterium]
MTAALVASNVMLWIAVVALSLTVLALVRQVGLLHERVAPAGALLPQTAVKVGERAPELTLHDLDGSDVKIGGPDDGGRTTLLFFLSPTCPVCETLLPTLLATARAEDASIRLVFASDGAGEAHAEYARNHTLRDWPYIVSGELGIAYQVAKLPFCVLLDAAGIVRAAGMVNTREHVESLFEASDQGVASIQDFIARRREGGDGRSAA